MSIGKSNMTLFTRIAALTLVMCAVAVPAALQAAEAVHPPRQSWSFAGPFGKFDRAQVQRGLRVYREVCQSCHSLSYVSFRNLAEPGGPGFSAAQAGVIASEYKIKDGPNDAGEMFERNGRPADKFPSPFPNDAAARVANNGIMPPDLSVMAKARTYERGFPWFLLDMFTQFQEHGVDYAAALLTGYEDPPPAGVTLPPGTYYNRYFPGNAIAMPPPLSNGQIEYTDGTPATVEQYARDVAAFMAWTAEPHMEARKRIGLQVMIFLLVFAGLLYFAKKKVWKGIPDHA